MSKFPKLILQVSVNTLCRHEKTTTWYEIGESGFVPPNGFTIVKESVDCSDFSLSIRTALLGCWMLREGVFNPDLVNVLLPPIEGLYKGMGAIAAFVQKEENGPVESFSTLPFDFDQEAGGPIKLKFGTVVYGPGCTAAGINAKYPFIGQDAGPQIDPRALYAGLKQFYAQVDQHPLIKFDVSTGDDEYKLHGKEFYFLAEDQEEEDGIPAKCVFKVGLEVANAQLEVFTVEFPRDEDEDVGCSWLASDHWDPNYMDYEYVNTVMDGLHNFIYAYQNGKLPGVPAPVPESFAASVHENPLADKLNTVVKGNTTKH